VAKRYKIPVSVLVVIHTPDLQVLLLERADRPGFWQSVTGSQNEGETLVQTAQREVSEETGLDASRCELADWAKQNEFEIYQRWRGRYAPGITHNTEHVFSLRVPYATSGCRGVKPLTRCSRGAMPMPYANCRSGLERPRRITLLKTCEFQNK